MNSDQTALLCRSSELGRNARPNKGPHTQYETITLTVPRSAQRGYEQPRRLPCHTAHVEELTLLKPSGLDDIRAAAGWVAGKRLGIWRCGGCCGCK